MTVGSVIRKLRLEDGLTQQSLSILTGLSQRHINHIEHDRKQASLNTLTAISDATQRQLTINHYPKRGLHIEFKIRETLRCQSFDHQVLQNESRLYADCLTMCNYNTHDAEDLKQETLCAALLNHNRYNQQDCNLYTWLYAIAKNIHRSDKRNAQYLVYVDHYFDTGEHTPELSENTDLVVYLNRLSDKAKSVYKMRMLNYSYDYIAKELNITHDGAKSWYWTIKGKLKKLIGNI